MSFISKLFGSKNTNDTNTEPIINNVNAAVDQALAGMSTTTDTIARVNLAKNDVHKVCLTKPILNGLKAQVGLVLDFSGSMQNLYENGTVQKVVEKILPMAMEFDDNQTMEVWIFENGYHRLPDVTLSNLVNYVSRETKRYSMGGTKYTPVMKDVIATYEKSKLPSYVLFITDGDCFDAGESETVIKDASRLPIFWQFVGLGSSCFTFLEKLDDMSGRYVDNADFFKVDSADKITYFNLLNEFPSWLSNDKIKSMMG